MKISKLFHWLYASLMLLPLLVFIPNAFYYGFNEHAVSQEKTEQIPVYYESNEVNDINDFHLDYIYRYTNSFTSSFTGSNSDLFRIDIDFFKVQFPQYSGNNITSVTFVLTNQGKLNIYMAGSQVSINIDSIAFDFIPIRMLNTSLTSEYLIPYIQKSSYKYVKEYQPLVTSMSITDSMSYAWDSVWQNDLFSWSYGSFLTEPFIYIGNIFNVPLDNSLYYALSYWLDISIIWLVFDVIMYIPLLVHRWLDKGIVE